MKYPGDWWFWKLDLASSKEEPDAGPGAERGRQHSRIAGRGAGEKRARI